MRPSRVSRAFGTNQLDSKIPWDSANTHQAQYLSIAEGFTQDIIPKTSVRLQRADYQGGVQLSTYVEANKGKNVLVFKA